MIADKEDLLSQYSASLKQIQGIKAADLVELKVIKTPTNRVKIVAAAICYALGAKVNLKKDSSESYKEFTKLLNSPKEMMAKFTTFDPKNFSMKKMENLEAYMKKNDLLEENSVNTSKKSSKIAGSMHQWLLAMVNISKSQQKKEES